MKNVLWGSVLLATGALVAGSGCEEPASEVAPTAAGSGIGERTTWRVADSPVRTNGETVALALEVNGEPHTLNVSMTNDSFSFELVNDAGERFGWGAAPDHVFEWTEGERLDIHFDDDEVGGRTETYVLNGVTRTWAIEAHEADGAFSTDRYRQLESEFVEFMGTSSLNGNVLGQRLIGLLADPQFVEDVEVVAAGFGTRRVPPLMAELCEMARACVAVKCVFFGGLTNMVCYTCAITWASCAILDLFY